MKVLKAIAALFLLLFVSYVLYLNVRLYYKPTFFAYGNTSVNEDVQKQLKFLNIFIHRSIAVSKKSRLVIKPYIQVKHITNKQQEEKSGDGLQHFHGLPDRKSTRLNSSHV